MIVRMKNVRVNGFYYYSPSGTFVALTANQFVGRDYGLLGHQR